MTTKDGNPERQFLKEATLDHLMQAIVALSSEVYVLRERLARLEGAKGAAAVDPERDAADFVKHVFGHIGGERSGS